jgi:hypothetical protein
MRPELEALPLRMTRLPIDDRGYPVPWFVAWVKNTAGETKPEFRAMDPQKYRCAIREKRCWVCGQRLGSHLAFVAGPMCGINRTSSEPPSHLECAEWSARNCPFLTRPHVVRREDETINNEKLVAQSAGICITRNPGVTMVWVTKAYKIFDDGEGKPLIQMGAPERVIWYAEGRLAMREEVVSSVENGFPALLEVARKQRGGEAEALKMRKAFESFYPPKAVPEQMCDFLFGEEGTNLAEESGTGLAQSEENDS